MILFIFHERVFNFMETDTKYKKNAHFFFSVYLLDVNGNFTDEFKYLQKTPVDFES